MALLLPPLARREFRCPGLDVARERQRRPADLGVGPAGLDPDVDVDPARARRLRPADEPDRLERLLADERDLADLGPLDPGHRVEVHPELVGWSRSSARTGCGLRSMQPRLTTQASPAASSRTISSAVRPDGKVSSAVRIQSGVLSGARFWKKGSFVDPVDEPLQGHRPAARARAARRRPRRGSTRRGPSSCSRARGSRPCPGSRWRPRGRRSRGPPCGWAWCDASRRSQGGAGSAPWSPRRIPDERALHARRCRRQRAHHRPLCADRWACLSGTRTEERPVLVSRVGVRLTSATAHMRQAAPRWESSAQHGGPPGTGHRKEPRAPRAHPSATRRRRYPRGVTRTPRAPMMSAPEDRRCSTSPSPLAAARAAAEPALPASLGRNAREPIPAGG